MSLAIPPTIQCRFLTVDSGDAYADAISRRVSQLSVLTPQAVFYPTEYTDIPTIFEYATSQNPPLEIAVKGGGVHPSPYASSEGGIVVDLSKLNNVSLSSNKKTITVQGGAVWEDVYKVCQEAQVEVVGSPLWFVGVGGFTLGGGYSPLSGEYGLTIDNLLSAIVVLSDGRIVKTSPEEEPDLFWAIRGGGNQFGIIVEFLFKTHPSAGPFSVGTLIYEGSEVPRVLKAIQDWKAKQAGKTRLNIMFVRPGPHFTPKIMLLPWISGTDLNEKDVLAPFRKGATPIVDKVRSVPDMLTLSHGSDASFAAAPKRLIMRGGFITDLWTDMFIEVYKRWSEHTGGNEDVRSSAIMWDITSPTRISEVAQSATAAHVRSHHYWFSVQGRSNEPRADDLNQAFVASVASYIREFNTQKTGEDLGVWLSMSQGDESAEDVFKENLPRLRKIKAKYDPKKMWSRGIVIDPDFN